MASASSVSSLGQKNESSLLYRLIRIYPHELGRTSVIWIIRFLYRFVFVLSWTLIVVQVSSTYHGGYTLPYLFLLHAFLVFCGSTISYFLFQRYHLEYVFLTAIVIGVGVLFGVQFLPVSDITKVGVLLFVESGILVQLSINIETFTERLFTPVESNRTFPVVESADTIATLLAGLLLFLQAQSLTPSRVIWIVTGILSLLIPLFLQYHSFIRSLPGLCLYRKQLLGHSKEEHRSEIFIKAKKQPYIRLLVIIILSQWFFAVVLEFLFTSSISSQVIHQTELVPAASGAVENLLIHEFGLLQIFCALAALVSHFLLAGRLISSLGIMGSMVLHPLVSLLSLAGMIVNFGYFSAVVSRLNSEVTGVIFRNAYQSSYYVFEETKSQFIRILLDGIVRPIGSLFGTFFLLFSYYLISSSYYITFVLFGVFVVLIVFALATFGLQKCYTQQVIAQIKDPHTSVELKLSLLDVLAQKGHQHIYGFLQSLYDAPHQSPLLKMKLMEIFSKEKEYIQDVLTGLKDTNPAVRYSSLEALINMSKKGFFDTQPLSREMTLKALKDLYLEDSDNDLRYKTILFLATFKDKEIMEFLLDLLQTESADSLAEVIQACDAFGDPSFVLYFEQFLDSSDPRVWSSAAIALYRHEKYASRVLDFLKKKTLNPSKDVARALAFAFADIAHKHFQGYMEHRLSKTDDPREKMLLSYGLIKLSSSIGVSSFFDMIFHDDLKYAHQARRLVYHLPALIQRRLDGSIQHESLSRLHIFLKAFSGKNLKDLSLPELHYLRDAYTLLNVTEEIMEIDYILREKDDSYRPDISHFGYLPLTPSLYV